MITIRQIERLFNDQQWLRLYHELIANRPEALSLHQQTPAGAPRVSSIATDFPKFPKSPHIFKTQAEGLATTLSRVVPISALAMIRLDELSQAHHPFYRRLLNVILTGQQSDGGWGDLLTTALCVRALIAGGAGSGAAVNGGLGYLAALQKSEGAWPNQPIRRLPADGFITAFILHQLGEFTAFRSAVRFDDAVTWFAVDNESLDDQTRRLWLHARTRCRLATTYRPAPLFSPRPAA